MRNSICILVVGVSLIARVPVWAAETPVVVSPGSASGSLIGNRCPTFSWGEVSGAKSYELVVYRLAEEGEEAQPVLRETVTGAASSWTPSLDRCLKRGGQYAWSVRVGGEKEAPEWSAPSLFEVAAGPSGLEFEEALQVVRSYLEAGSESMLTGSEAAEAEVEAVSDTGLAAASSPVSPAPGVMHLSVDGGVVETSAQRRLRSTPEAVPLAGATQDAFLTIQAMEFSPWYGTSTITPIFGISCVNGCGVVAGAPVPHGATIVGLEIDACDTNPNGGDIVVVLARIAGNEGSVAPETLKILQVTQQGCAYTVGALDPPHVVNQYLDSYVVSVSLNSGTSAERFQAVRVYYRPGSGAVVPQGTETSLFP